jgi:hypothetical protein
VSNDGIDSVLGYIESTKRTYDLLPEEVDFLDLSTKILLAVRVQGLSDEALILVTGHHLSNLRLEYCRYRSSYFNYLSNRMRIVIHAPYKHEPNVVRYAGPIRHLSHNIPLDNNNLIPDVLRHIKHFQTHPFKVNRGTKVTKTT